MKEDGVWIDLTQRRADECKQKGPSQKGHFQQPLQCLSLAHLRLAIHPRIVMFIIAQRS